MNGNLVFTNPEPLITPSHIPFLPTPRSSLLLHISHTAYIPHHPLPRLHQPIMSKLFLKVTLTPSLFLLRPHIPPRLIMRKVTEVLAPRHLRDHDLRLLETEPVA